MISKLKGIILVVIISLASIMMPFDIYADTITTSNINGISITLDEVTFIEYKQFIIDNVSTNVARNYYNYIAEIQFDKSYLGYININMQYTYQARNDTGMVTYNGTKLQKVFVNGDKAYMSFGFVANSNTDPLWYNSVTYSLTNSDVIEYGLISDIQQIVNILEENQDIIEDIYTELLKVVSNTSLANTYLNNIDDNLENIDNLIDKISWNVMESDIGYRTNLSDNPTDWTTTVGAFNGYLTFSYSNLRTFDNILKIYLPVRYTGSLSDIRLYFDNGSDVTNEYLLYITRSRIGLTLYMISDSSTGFFGTGHINIKGDYTYVYAPRGINGDTSLSYLPSDDIEYWHLRTFFINDKYLSLIANGTTQSNSASSQLEQEASEYSEIADDVIGVEEGLTSNFETNVNQIDLSSGLNVFGGNFMTSATWVRTQFDRLTENTPYGSLVVYGLTLGFALLMLGKVFL